MIRFPPELAEWIPAFGGLFVMACGWTMIFYTKYQRRAARLRNEKGAAE